MRADLRDRGSTSQLAVVACLGSALLAALFTRPRLPVQFLLDDGHILRAAQDPSTSDAASFRAIAGLYRALGLSEAAPLAALLGVAVFALAVVAAIGWQDMARLDWLGLAMLVAATAIAVVYLGQFSKELVTVSLAAVTLLLPRTALGEAGVVLACVMYGLLLRPYWLLIAVAYLGLRLLQRHRAHPLLLGAMVVAGYAVLSVLFSTVLGGGLESQREWINAERAGTAVDTLIRGPFPEATGPLSVLSVLVVLAMLLVPLPLLASGDPEHIAAALTICAVWALVLRQLLRRPPRPAADAPRSTANAPRAATLLLAVVTVQALFEPDYGSYLKHLSGLLPLALALVPLRPLPAPEQADRPAVAPRGSRAAVNATEVR